MSQFTPPPLPHNEAGREMARETHAETVERAEQGHPTRLRSPRLLRPLLAAVAVGAVLWFIGAAVFYIRVIEVGSGGANPGRWVLWFQAAQVIGEALCLGSAATLIARLAFVFVIKNRDDGS